MQRILRRRFLQAAATAAVAPYFIPGSALGKDGRPAPSERMTLGCIGTGNNGINWLRNFLNDKRVQIVAVCDVNKRSNGYWADREGGREAARDIVQERYAKDSGKQPSDIGCATYGDFREILQHADLDAVQIATPDHWHALMVIAAAKAGKHIYGQKPLSLTIKEGRAMSDAVAKAGITFQTGSQQRSMIHFRTGINLIRNGFIGKVHTVRVGLPSGHPDYSKHGSEKDPTPVPEGLDYDLWLGPAPEAYYCPARLHVNWRWNLDYSGGQMTDWGAHHIDIAQWAMGHEKTGPVEIKQVRGELPPRKDLYNTPDTFHWECTYEDGLKLIIGSDQRNGVTFEGEDGKSIYTNRGQLQSTPDDIKKNKITDDMKHIYESNDHVGNFVDCVFSGKEPIAPIEDAHRSITIAHLANIALQLERESLKWDPKAERVVDDEKANAMLIREYRGSWKLDV
ncbi:MAG: gfo/Idh/MocA family oxidoreductase [Phycisphaera sp.]|nr:gfo/Idh/MocA family oxidoreductase [Phycisphaera sp.]